MKRFLPLLFCCAAIGLAPLLGHAQERVLASRKVCELQDKNIAESSGLVASRKYSAANLLWTHNDSGNSPTIYLINLKGETVAEVLLQNAVNYDWEDIAFANGYIYIGDTGDNLRQRENVVIYRLKEPDIDSNKTGQKLSLPCEKTTLTYPTGPRDAETLMVTGQNEIVIVSKNFGLCGVYLSKPFQDDTAQVLTRVGQVAFDGVSLFSHLPTGGDLSPDGSRFVVRTYTNAFEWRLPADRNWKKIDWSTPSTWALPATKQGEAICYSADGNRYYLSSEKLPTPIYEMEHKPAAEGHGAP